MTVVDDTEYKRDFWWILINMFFDIFFLGLLTARLPQHLTKTLISQNLNKLFGGLKHGRQSVKPAP